MRNATRSHDAVSLVGSRSIANLKQHTNTQTCARRSAPIRACALAPYSRGLHKPKATATPNNRAWAGWAGLSSRTHSLLLLAHYIVSVLVIPSGYRGEPVSSPDETRPTELPDPHAAYTSISHDAYMQASIPPHITLPPIVGDRSKHFGCLVEVTLTAES